MKKSLLFIPLGLSAPPAFAQEATAEAVGAGVGLLIGLTIMVIVGAIVGWLAGLIVKGGSSGFWGNVFVGIGGSILAGFIFPLVGYEVGTSVLTSIIPSVIGAAILLLIVRMIRRGAA